MYVHIPCEFVCVLWFNPLYAIVHIFIFWGNDDNRAHVHGFETFISLNVCVCVCVCVCMCVWVGVCTYSS